MDNKIRFFSGLMTSGSFQSVLGKQVLTLPDAEPSRIKNSICSNHGFTISQKYVEEWDSLFKTGQHIPDIPFMYYWPTMINFLMNTLLPSLGLNLRNVFHIGHESEIIEKNFCSPGKSITIKHRLMDIVPVREDKIVLVTDTEIVTLNGTPTYRARDYTIVMNIRPGEIKSLREKPGLGKDPLTFMQKGFRHRPPKFSKPQKNEISHYCDNDLALRFGFVAGAVNITHGVWLISRFFKRGNPFLQGTCTANLIILLLTLHRGENIRKFSVYFNNKLFIPGTVSLRYDGHEFELLDSNGTVVSFGSRITDPQAKNL